MSATHHSAEVTIPSDLAEARRVQTLIEDALQGSRFTEHDIFAIRLALEEALVNAIKHGNQLDENKQVRICCRLFSDRLWVEIADEGIGFDPECVPDCTADENLCVPNGRGIMLMRSFMSRVEYNSQGNCVVLEKERAAGA